MVWLKTLYVYKKFSQGIFKISICNKQAPYEFMWVIKNIQILEK